MMTLRFGFLMLALAWPMMTLAAADDDARLSVIERRLDAMEHRPPGSTVAQADSGARIDAIERRLDALERRLGGTQAAPAPQAAQPQPQSPTAAVQLPGGAIQQVPRTSLPAPTPSVPAAQASYRALGIRKGMSEADVIKLLGPPVKISRGTVDVFFYGKDSIEPNVDFQYGSVINWND